MPQEQPHRSNPTAAVAALIALYGWAEAALLTRLARLVRAAPPTPTAAAAVAVGARRAVVQALTVLEQRTPALVDAVVQAETSAGTRAADAALALYVPHHAHPGTGGGGQPPGSGIAPAETFYDSTRWKAERAAEAIRADLTSELQDVRARITRLPDDVYKAIAPLGAISQVIDRGVTPVQAQAAAWQTFVQQGITGFTDRAGRNWTLSAYTEMAVRTAAHRAYLAADLARMQAVGIRLYTVPDEDHACPLCFPWQHRILIDPAFPPLNGEHFDATIDEARAAGLFHPNCRHPLLPVFPGITHLAPRQWGDENQAAYRATQRLRYLERRVRQAKSAAEHAATPEAAAEARRKVRRAQAAIRAHLEQRPDLNRRPRREQLDLGLRTPRLPGAGD